MKIVFFFIIVLLSFLFPFIERALHFSQLFIMLNINKYHFYPLSILQNTTHTLRVTHIITSHDLLIQHYKINLSVNTNTLKQTNDCLTKNAWCKPEEPLRPIVSVAELLETLLRAAPSIILLFSSSWLGESLVFWVFWWGWRSNDDFVLLLIQSLVGGFQILLIFGLWPSIYSVP